MSKLKQSRMDDFLRVKGELTPPCLVSCSGLVLNHTPKLTVQRRL